MCITQRKEVDIAEAKGWKMFSVKANGELQSPFAGTHYLNKTGELLPEFITNTKIEVIPETSVFYTFKNFEDACNVANNPRRWNVVNNKLIIFPVVCYKICAEGNLFVRSEDEQCSDGYYPVYESKEILIHDSEEIRLDFFQKIISKKMKQMHLSYLEKIAFQSCYPQIKIA